MESEIRPAGCDRYYLDLVGPFRLRASNDAVIRIASRKSRAIVALLALAPGGNRGRAWLQTLLWGSRFRQHAQASLRRELANLSMMLHGGGAEHLIVRTATTVTLNLSLIDVDVLGLGPGLPTPTSQGVFLEDVDLPDSPEFMDWLFAQRTRITELQQIQVPRATTSPGALEIIGGPLPPTAELLGERLPSVPPKPSVCVLPFRALSIDPEDPIGLGIAQELGMTLARFQSLFVVTTPTSLTGWEAEAATPIAKRLGVAYLVGGTVQRAHHRVRVTACLVSGGSGQQLWSETFEGYLDDVFALQKQIIAALAPRIHTQIDVTELRGALSGAIRSGSAYALYWRANALFRQWDQAANTEARELCERLLAMEPTSGWAAALAAFCHAVALASSWAEDPAETRRIAVAHYQQALRFASDDPTVLGYAAGTLVSLGGDLDVAERLIGHALTLLPSFQPTLFWGGWVALAQGNAALACERFELSLRVNPLAGVRAYAVTGIGWACLLEGRFADAYQALREAVQFIPDYPFTGVGYCVAAQATGARLEARDAAVRCRSNGALDAVVRVLARPDQRAMVDQLVRQATGSRAEHS